MTRSSDGCSDLDVIILGAGAAGLFCAAETAARGRRTLIVDHARKAAEKVRISGGGRCNFTNIHTSPENFLSQNPHFCKSALKRFTAQDFLDRINARGISWHEKKLGQLFCDGSSRQIVDMLVEDAKTAGAEIRLSTPVGEVARRPDDRFEVKIGDDSFTTRSLIVATGGLSIPKMGATGLAYDLARQFNLQVIEPRPALVPFTFESEALEPIKALAGVSVDGLASTTQASFQEAILFTHRGLSGPAILQISSFWRDGEEVTLDLVNGTDAAETLVNLRQKTPKQSLANGLSTLVPKRLAQTIAEETFPDARLAELSNQKLKSIAQRLQSWTITPDGTEGWRTAEVTSGGIDTNELSSRTMEAKSVPGLYFIGEAVDVTGWLGGYNFQWAWSSASAAGAHA